MNFWMTLEVGSIQLTMTFMHFLWQGALVGLLFLVAMRFTSRSSAQVRYLIACATLACLPLCVLVTFVVVNRNGGSIWIAAGPVETDSVVRPNLGMDSVTSGFDAEDTVHSEAEALGFAQPELTVPQTGRFWQPILKKSAPFLSLVYFVGVVVMLARLSISMSGCRRLRSTMKSVKDPALLEMVRRRASQMRMAFVPLVAICDRVTVPVVIGILKPTILLPPALLCGLDANQLAAILSHELAHIRRHDLLVGFVQRVVESALFFHPVTWWISRRVRFERELCCDDLATSDCGRLLYADALLQMAELCARKRGMAIGPQLQMLAADGADASQLGIRIRRLLGEETAPPVLVSRRWLAMFVLGFAVLGASAIGSAQTQNTPADEAAVAAKDSEADGKPAAEEVEVRYPYCLVEFDQLSARPVSDAIEAFNRQSLESPIGRLEPPIGEQETLDAINAFVKLSHIPDNVKDKLREIVATKELPGTAYFRRFTRYDDGDSMHRVWWVRLVIDGNEGPVYSVPVRTKDLFSRPYTQMERQQNASDGVTLINRFSTYFQVAPNILLLREFDRDAQDRIVELAKSAIGGDAQAFEQLYRWEDVSAKTRGFVKDELDQLRDLKVESIEVRPRNFRGELVHWSAYQRYQPNLPIVGYLDIRYKSDAGDGASTKTLSLEMGESGDELKLVNYVKFGKAEFPNTITPRISIRGSIEPIADGAYFITTTVTNPGTLLSAHLSNEEIWKRSFAAR